MTYILRVDLSHYWNRVYCECLCHIECYREMKGLPCQGCEKFGCEVTMELYTLYERMNIGYNFPMIPVRNRKPYETKGKPSPERQVVF